MLAGVGFLRVESELIPDQARDLAAVRAALCLAHHVADERADRLGVAGAYLLRRLGVGCERRRDDLRESRVRCVERSEPLALDDRRRVATFGNERLRTSRAASRLTCLGRDQLDEPGEARGLTRERPGSHVRTDPLDELRHPVGERDRIDGRRPTRAPARRSRPARSGRRARARARPAARARARSARARCRKLR